MNCIKCSHTVYHKYNICERCYYIYYIIHLLKHTKTCQQCNYINLCNNCFDANYYLSLNQQQKNAINIMRTNYLTCNNINNNIYCNYTHSIYGPAGTGKTYMISFFINLSDIKKLTLVRKIAYSWFITPNEILSYLSDDLPNIDIDDVFDLKITCAAPTNKAVGVIKNNVSKFIINNKHIQSITISKLLNYKMVIDYNNGIKTFKRKINFNNILYNHDIIIIDETSMIKKEEVIHLLSDIANEYNIKLKDKNDNYIIQTARSIFNKLSIDTNNNQHEHYAFIVFIGDTCQLPPVKEKNSLLFDFNIKHNNLDIIERTNHDNIKKLSNYFRNIIIQKTYPNIKIIFDNIKLFNIPITNFENSVNEYINNIDNSIYLCWRHENRQQITNYIRYKLFNNIDTKFNKNEWIMFTEFHRIKINSEYINFYTSTSAKIIDIIGPNSFSINYDIVIGKHYYDEDYEINYFNFVVKYLIENVMKLNNFYTYMKNHFVKINYESNIYTIYIPDDYQKYNTIKTNIHSYIKKYLSQLPNNITYAYFDNINLFHKIKNDFIYNIWNVMYDVFIDVYANIDYKYCITVDSSQGSTYDNVYVDINDIFIHSINNESMRRVYTAITRTKNKLTIIN